MIPGSSSAHFFGAAGSSGGYEIERSLRFNSADSAYLSRTPASAGNRKTWTWSGWVKRAKLNAVSTLLSVGLNTDGDTGRFLVVFDANDRLAVDGATVSFRTTTAVYRDPSSWYHVLLSVDTTQVTANNRIRVYINGTEVTAFDLLNNPSQNADTGINRASAHNIGRRVDPGDLYANLCLADIHFIDGQALTPTSFGEFDTNGVWQPKAYSGTYGTNGFHLEFLTGSGTDTSGNNNFWTAFNFGTSGAGNDSLVDTPTNYGTDTGAGGEVRGNYATLNPLDNNSQTLANGNLDVTGSLDTGSVNGTIAVSSGKYYWEITASASGGDIVGIWSTSSRATNYPGATADSYGYNQFNGQKYNNGSASAYGATFSSGDVIGVALDMDAGTLVFYKNGVSQGTAFSSLTGSFRPSVRAGYTSNPSAGTFANFGQRPFAYTAPSGFKALCTQNLPEPTIADGSTAMDVVLYTGNGSTQTISGLGFSPDLVWLKGRTNIGNHGLYDTVRGVSKQLLSNDTAAETTNPGVFAFNSDGFDVGPAFSQSSNAWVAWTWDAGSSTVTNTAGTITSQVRANPSAGFSVVTYTGNGITGATVGHGLGVAPGMIILKRRDAASTNWYVYHSTIGATGAVTLNLTAGTTTSGNFWNNTAPTSSVVTISANAGTEVNGNGGLYLLYCFAPVAGYSAFGSYTGNGSADGPFVYLGFRPAVVLVKMSSSTGNWTMLDYKREGYNVDNDPLYPNLSNAEGTTDLIDITSNGFKVRTTDASVNTNAGTYIYAAWAESPFALARAR